MASCFPSSIPCRRVWYSVPGDMETGRKFEADCAHSSEDTEGTCILCNSYITGPRFVLDFICTKLKGTMHPSAGMDKPDTDRGSRDNYLYPVAIIGRNACRPGTGKLCHSAL